MGTSAEVRSPAISTLTRDLLVWIDRAPRTYPETMEAWRSHCPRLTIWEDALADGLLCVRSGDSMPRRSMVELTDRGRAALDAEQGSST